MNQQVGRSRGRNYAWVVVAVTFLALLTAAGVRSAPGVLMTPLHETLGWSRGDLSLAAAIGIFLYGLVGPFAATSRPFWLPAPWPWSPVLRRSRSDGLNRHQSPPPDRAGLSQRHRIMGRV